MDHSYLDTLVAFYDAIYATVLSPKAAKADGDRGVLHIETSTKTADEAFT
jgi:hypothetical protein